MKPLLAVQPSSCSAAAARQGSAMTCRPGVCSFTDNGSKLKLIHRTSTGGIPGAMTPFRGQLLAGVGSALRLYEAGAVPLAHKLACCSHHGIHGWYGPRVKVPVKIS